MGRERTLTELELLPTVWHGQNWVRAHWRRADGSEGSVEARFRLKTRTRWYIAELNVGVPTTALLRDVPLARIEAAANANPAIREWIEKGSPAQVAKARRLAARRRRRRLERPTTRRLDAEFYAHVADCYRDAVAEGLNPAKTLAEDSGEPQGNVNRWIAEARERGKLPREGRGKVTF
jgi:hypothetical protein